MKKTIRYKKFRIVTYKHDGSWWADCIGSSGTEGVVGPINSRAAAIAQAKRDIKNYFAESKE